MVPTLIGITFVVFMIIALAPGGIGASLRVSGGQMDANSRTIREAYLEDRYGLDDPAPVQYVRWLSRISPIKFGTRDQIDPTGEYVPTPKTPKQPPLWELFADELPQKPEIPAYTFEVDSPEAKASVFRRQKQEYARTRAALITNKALLDEQIGSIADQLDFKRIRDGKGKIRYGVVNENLDDFKSHEQWGDLETRGQMLVESYANSLEEWSQLTAIFDAKPFPEAGIGIIPGLSLSWPDFGRSFTKSRPVVDLITDAIPITILLNLIATPIIYFVAIPCGMLAAVKSGSMFDRLSGAFFIGLWSFPIPLAGVLAIGYLANNDYLGWFPVAGLHDSNAELFTYLPTITESGAWHRGYLLDLVWHVCLPVLCLVYGGFAVLSKQTRAAMLDNFNMDYVRTAKAKGVANGDIITRHVFRNSLLPLITMFVTIFPAMLAGSVVIEQIFTVPGMGRLTLESINLRDRELLLANTMMIAGVNLLALLMADILYAMADPRISYK
jgi:peptide/nickel transport system permease protein